MAPRQKILFCTHPEYGQSNVALAVAYELALKNVNIHFASFSGLKRRVVDLEKQLHNLSAPTSTISFYPIAGLSMMESLQRQFVTDDLMHGDGIKNAIESYHKLPRILATWSGEEYIAIMECLKETIIGVKPDIVVVDGLFSHALDACTALNQKHVVLSPNTLKELVGPVQPWLAMFWKYPVYVSLAPLNNLGLKRMIAT
jgi:hypothetical protein